jgi:hypothetical protein
MIIDPHGQSEMDVLAARVKLRGIDRARAVGEVMATVDNICKLKRNVDAALRVAASNGGTPGTVDLQIKLYNFLPFGPIYKIGEEVMFMLAIGGSATSDGGAGLVQALGARLFDARGALVRRGGGALRQVERVELADMKARIDGVEFVIASDVDNRLLGQNGAAHVFGPQKGVSRDDIDVLEQGLALWASVVSAATGRYSAEDPGSGAAEEWASPGSRCLTPS